MPTIAKKSGKLCPHFEKDGIEYIKLPGTNGKYEEIMPLFEWKDAFDRVYEEYLKWLQQYSKKQEAPNAGKRGSYSYS